MDRWPLWRAWAQYSCDDLGVSDAEGGVTRSARPFLALLLAVTLVTSGFVIAASVSAQSPAIETGPDQRALTTSTDTAVTEAETSWEHQVNGTTRMATFAGSGTPADPYTVDSLADLQAIDKNGTTCSYAYELDTNLDASATRNWNGGEGFDPIDSFSGTFDGNGNEISDLYIDRPNTNNVGLFGSTGSSGSVSNVHLENVSVDGRNDVGGLVGNNGGQIDGSSATGNVTGSTRVGGLIGELGSTTVSNSYADVTVEGGSYVGGFVGKMTTGGGEITGSFARGDVSGTGEAGGFVGQAGEYVSLTSLLFGPGGTTRIRGPGDPGWSGCTYGDGSDANDKIHDANIGIGDRVYISNSYASGNVTGGTAGGFAGVAGETAISNSFATGKIPETSLFGTGAVGKARRGGDNDPCPKHTIWRGAPRSKSTNNYASADQVTGDNAANTGFDFENTWKIVTADDPRTDVDRVLLRGVDENAQFDSAERLEIADTDLDGVVAGTTNTIEITAFDFAGELDTNVPIEVVDADGVSGLTAEATTNDIGVATVSFTETTAGTYTITFANVDKPDISNTGSVTVVADSVGATGADGTAAGSISEVTRPSSGAGVTGTIEVNATDRFGNPVPGANLSVASNSSLGGLANGTSVSTNDSGVATLEFTETRAGDYDIELVDESATVTQTVTVTVTNHPDGVSGDEGGSITVEGPPTTSAGQQQVFEVVATDVYGNRVGGENISVTAPTGIAGIEDTVTTSESGVATFNSPELVGGYEIEFSDETGAFTDTANVTVDPDSEGLSGGDGGTVSAVTPPEAAAGQAGVIELNVRDQFGNLLPNETVIVAANDDLGGLAVESATTSNSSGVARFEFTETSAGDYEITFADDTFGDPILLPGESTRGTETVTVSNDPEGVSGGAGGEIVITTTQVNYDRGSITATATDQYGNPVVGETLSVGADSEIGDPAQIADTNADGVADIGFAETTAGDYSLTVADESGEITDTATVQIAPHSDGVSGGGGGTVAAETTVHGDSTSTVEITAEDASGNRVIGETIRIVDADGISGLDGVTADTNDTGVATMRISGTIPGEYTLTFSDDSGAVDDTTSVTVAANSEGVAGGSGGQVTVPASQHSTADREMTITVNASDENGVRVPNESISVTDAADIPDLEGATAVTDESGVATFTFSQHVAGNYEITFADQSGSFAATTTATVAAHSKGVSSGGDITGKPTATPGGTGISVNPTDRFGNPVGGESIKITDADGISDLEGATAVTDSDGETTFSFRGVREGNYNVSLEAGGVTRTVPISVTANSNGVSGGQGGSVTAPAPPATRAGQTNTVMIAATDESGVFVPNETIQVRSTDGLGGLSSGTTVETSADGVANFKFNETRAGTYTVEFTDESGSVSNTTTVSVTADSEGAVENGAITSARTPVGIADEKATLELLATDQYGNPVPNAPVTITSTGIKGGVGELDVIDVKTTTSESGVAAFRFNETVPGEYAVDLNFEGATGRAPTRIVASVYDNLNVDRGPDDDGSSPAKTGTHSIHGTVTHTNGVSADGGRVTVVKADGSHRQNVLIDVDGNYEVDVPAGTYRVIVDRPGSPRATVETVKAEQATAEPTDLTLNIPGTIVGFVSDPQQAAVSNLPVQIVGEGRTYYARTNSSGSYQVDVPPGTYVVAPLGSGAGLGSREVTITEGGIEEISVELQPQSVDDSPELRIVDGPGNLSVDGHEMVVIPEISDGLLQVQIANASDSGRDLDTVGDPSELAGFGVTSNTTFEITVTVRNYTPHSLFWAIRDAEFTAAQNPDDPTATDITIRGSPVALATTSAQKKRVGPMVDEDPASVLWPSGTDDTADTKYDQTVIFSIYDLSTQPAALRDRLTGMVLTTNAQQISLPAVVDGRLRTWIAAPRFESLGVEYEGFYQATIPEGQLDEWGVDSAEHQLFAEYKSTDRDLTVTAEADGVSLDVSNVTYSASFVDIMADSASPIPGQDPEDDSSPGTGSEDDSETVVPPAPPEPDPEDQTDPPAPAEPGSGDQTDQPASAEPDADAYASTSSEARAAGAAGDAGGTSSGVGSVVAAVTIPIQWFGGLTTVGKGAVAVASGAGAAGAAYSFGGDRIRTPVNMARRRLQSWLRRRLRGSTRQQITRLVARLRTRLAWSNVRARLAALRKYFRRSYWREWVENRRELATREGLRTFLVGTYRSYRKRQWRGWLRGRLRGGVGTISGGFVTSLAPGWLAPVSGPVGAALGVVVAEIQRWIEDVVMGKFDALGKRYSRLMLRSSALLTDTTDRLWYYFTGETPPTTDPSVSSIAGGRAAALREVGIESADQLAAADPDHLANAVAVAPTTIDEWIEQAGRRGTKSDRPSVAETVNGRRVRQRVGRVTERVATAGTTVITRLAEPAERGVRSLRTRTTLARTWVRDDALPAIVASAQRARTAVRRRTSERAARVRSTVSQLTTPINDQLGTADSGLRSIDGIGPAYSERLSEAGLTTVDEVARADPERVAMSIGVSPKRVYRWTAQARSAEWVGQRLRRKVAIRLVKAEVSVAALRDSDPAPLDAAVTSRAWGSLDAPSDAAMRRLSAVGIESVCHLAAADPDRLAAATNFDTDRTAMWIRAARIYQKHIVAR